MVPRPALENIRAVLELEREFAERRSLSDRIADAIAGFVGTVAFVLCHVLLFAGWTAVNTGLVPFIPPFDPFPFVFLCLIVSMEGVLMSTFVLIKQNRMGQRADQRAHLALQVNLLTEREVTKIITLLQAVCERLDIREAATDPEAEELAHVTAVDSIARELEERLSAGEGDC